MFRIKAFQDASAFDELILEYGPNVQRYLTKRLPSRQDAEDIFSETALRVWNYALTNQIDSFLGLSLTVARNVVAGFYKRRETHEETELTTDLADEQLADDRHTNLTSDIDARMLMADLEQHEDEETIQIIRLRYLEGYQVREIAKLFGKSENAVSIHIHRTLKRIQDRFATKYPNV